MVDLFKKKGNATPKPTKQKPTKQKPAKKPLFGGKKTVTNGTNGAVAANPKPAKKSGFGGLFGKKTQKSTRPVQNVGTEEMVAKPTAKKPLFGTTKAGKPKPAKAGAKPAKAPMNAQKLIILVGVLFLVVIAGLVAKIFLFSEPKSVPEPQPVATTSIPPAPKPVPEQAPVAPTPVEVMPTEAVPDVQPEEVIIERPSQSAAEVTVSEQPAIPAEPTTNISKSTPATQAEPAATPTPAEKITYQDFVEQSKNRVYRERSTEGQ